MRKSILTFAAVAFSLGATPARADVQLTIHDGLVSLSARDATVRQILVEWARVGQTKIVNAERVPGPPISLELTDVPEERALGILLRTISGYVAAPRPTTTGGLSRYDRIIVMPQVAPARAPTVAAAPQPAQPRFATPDDQVNDPVRFLLPPNPQAVPGGAPVFNTFPAPNPGVQPQPGAVPPGGAPPPTQLTSPTPTVPTGASRPGVIIQPTPPPGQPPGQGQPGVQQ